MRLTLSQAYNGQNKTDNGFFTKKKKKDFKKQQKLQRKKKKDFSKNEAHLTHVRPELKSAFFLGSVPFVALKG